ncbi:hypothetical protein KCU93_g10163, partial [Aureobasidium melanogenum]
MASDLDKAIAHALQLIHMAMNGPDLVQGEAEALRAFADNAEAFVMADSGIYHRMVNPQHDHPVKMFFRALSIMRHTGLHPLVHIPPPYNSGSGPIAHNISNALSIGERDNDEATESAQATTSAEDAEDTYSMPELEETEPQAQTGQMES